MEEFLSFPNPRLPTFPPTLDSLLVSLVDDQGSERYSIPNPLTSDDFTDRLNGGLAITGLNRVRETLSSPYNVPESLASRETWLRHLLEVLVGAHEGLLLRTSSGTSLWTGIVTIRIRDRSKRGSAILGPLCLVTVRLKIR